MYNFTFKLNNIPFLVLKRISNLTTIMQSLQKSINSQNSYNLSAKHCSKNFISQRDRQIKTNPTISSSLYCCSCFYRFAQNNKHIRFDIIAVIIIRFWMCAMTCEVALLVNFYKCHGADKAGTVIATPTNQPLLRIWWVCSFRGADCIGTHHRSLGMWEDLGDCRNLVGCIHSNDQKNSYHPIRLYLYVVQYEANTSQHNLMHNYRAGPGSNEGISRATWGKQCVWGEHAFAQCLRNTRLKVCRRFKMRTNEQNRRSSSKSFDLVVSGRSTMDVTFLPPISLYPNPMYVRV